MADHKMKGIDIMANIWWCNQGRTWKSERAHGVVCSSGETTRPDYRQTVGDVKAGDIIVHYRKPYIVAVSRAKEDGREGSVPPVDEFIYGYGWTFATEYFDLQHPIHRDVVNDAIYALDLPDSPVLSNGWIRQAYFMPFDRRGLMIVLAASDEDWPEWVKRSGKASMTFICPLPLAWARVDTDLRSFWEKQDPQGELPPKPLVLAGWANSDDSEKQLRWQETIRWAEAHGCLNLTDIEDAEEYRIE